MCEAYARTIEESPGTTPRERSMENIFQDYVRELVEELLPGTKVEFLPARQQPHTDSVYPVRFKTETADLIVGFPERMVLMVQGDRPVRETVTQLVRLVKYFRRRAS